MTKLALVLSGHAALGAYSAGAAMEILRALEDAGPGEAPPVGVVVGSGSGAISAGLAARSLVVNPGMIPWIERIWVDALDARHLLNPGRLDRSTLLDPAPLEEVTLHTIAGDPAADDRPGAALGDQLWVGVPLSLASAETGGKGHGRGPGPRGDRREARFVLGPRHDAGHPVWERVRRAALAATALPLAFPPRRLRLDGSGDPAAGEDGAAGERDGWYVGGGPARPRPLALARDLVRGGGVGGDDWRVLVVDPGGRSTDAGTAPGASADGWWGLDLLLAGGVPADLAADWAAAEDASHRVAMLRSLAARLPEVHGRLDDPGAVGLGRQIGALAERVAEREVEREGTPSGSGTAADPVVERLDAGLRRIQEHPDYAPAFGELESRAGRTRLAKLIYVLEAVADLQRSDPLRLHRVSPSDGDALAGRGMAGLGGFLSREWRRHDFVAGRRDARRVLEEELSDAVPYAPEGTAAYEPPRPRGLAESVDAPLRERLRSRLGEEADRVLELVRPGGLRGLFFGLARRGARTRLVDRAIRALDPTAGR